VNEILRAMGNLILVAIIIILAALLVFPNPTLQFLENQGLLSRPEEPPKISTVSGNFKEEVRVEVGTVSHVTSMLLVKRPTMLGSFFCTGDSAVVKKFWTAHYSFTIEGDDQLVEPEVALSLDSFAIVRKESTCEQISLDVNVDRGEIESFINSKDFTMVVEPSHTTIAKEIVRRLEIYDDQ
jgi:hypothetical protein